jgi:gamma-glutamylcyclotransferase (GGCT)/AIG2-like uncharacterized protein YtfP
MKTSNSCTEYLFSYGTLQQEGVQLATFGRKLDGEPSTLKGYRLLMVQITDQDVIAKSGSAKHPILSYTGNDEDEITGMVFKVSSDEISYADEYEVGDYKRIKVTLTSGVACWVYVAI